MPGSSTASAPRCSGCRERRRTSGAPPPAQHVPAAFLELFEERLPAMAEELAEGRTGTDRGVSLYHMLLEGVVFDAGQQALLDDLADDALPGVLRGRASASRATSAGTSASACGA